MTQKQGTHRKQSLFSLIAIFGMAFSAIGIGLTWYTLPKIQKSLLSLIDTIDQTLINTDDGLGVVIEALETSKNNLDVISSTLENLPGTIDNISNSLQSSGDLIGGELKDAIVGTKISLSSAATSAGLIDNTLKFIAAIPLLGADYRPEVPLSISLENVSESLNDIPESFLEIQSFIQDTDEGLVLLKSDTIKLSKSIQDFETVIIDAQMVIDEYNLIIGDLREQLTNFRSFISQFLLISGALVTIGFFLLGMSQFTSYRQNTLLASIEKLKDKQIEVQDK